MSIDKAPNINLLWASLLIEELVRSGVDTFCISPGSRSAPLAVAAAQNDSAQIITHFDERAAAFYALGMAKATQKPAALIATSGSAVANYMPAVVEAAMARVPLIVITADRPPELLQCGANQAIDQQHIFGHYTRWNFGLPCPSMEIPPGMVLTTADQAVYRATRTPAGPVHLNCMFREPLAPVADGGDYTAWLQPIADWLNSNRPFTEYIAPSTGLNSKHQNKIIETVNDAQRGLFIVGQLNNREESQAALKLATALKWPVFPDICSGLRLAPQTSGMIHYFDQMLLSKAFREACRPDLVIQIGGPLVSKRLQALLAQHRPHIIRAANHPERHDPDHLITQRVEMDNAAFCKWLAPSVAATPPNPSTSEWNALSQRVAGVIDEWLAEQEQLSEIGVARTVSRMAPAGSLLFLGNSMPVRDMDMFGTADGQGPFAAANRGASGIDGNISTAAGMAKGAKQPVTAIVGDLAALHDLNALALLNKNSKPVILIIINNDGGGIFSFLPIAKYPDTFDTCFATPHGRHFEHPAKTFDLPYYRPATPDEFSEVYEAALKAKKSVIIGVPTDRERNLSEHQQLQREIKAIWNKA